MATIKASGLIDKKFAVIECIERDNNIEVYKNGAEDFSLMLEIDALIAEKNEQLLKLVPDGDIDPMALESYLLILREEIFDEPPKIETNGVDDVITPSFTEEQVIY